MGAPCGELGRELGSRKDAPRGPPSWPPGWEPGKGVSGGARKGGLRVSAGSPQGTQVTGLQLGASANHALGFQGGRGGRPSADGTEPASLSPRAAARRRPWPRSLRGQPPKP